MAFWMKKIKDVTVDTSSPVSPVRFGGMTSTQKEQVARELFRQLEIDYLPFDPLRVCGYDFRVCSLVAYMLATELFLPSSKRTHPIEAVEEWLNVKDFRETNPLTAPIYLPVRYAGPIGYDRIFIINRCSFLSADALIGIRNSECGSSIPDSLRKIIKGLKDTGLCYNNWSIYRLDPTSTDDMTAVLALRVEKNFSLEFAHFREATAPEVIFRWVDC